MTLILVVSEDFKLKLFSVEKVDCGFDTLSELLKSQKLFTNVQESDYSFRSEVKTVKLTIAVEHNMMFFNCFQAYLSNTELRGAEYSQIWKLGRG